MTTYNSVDAGIRSAVVASAVVGEKVFLDFAPTDTLPDYCTMNSNVGTTPSVKGDSRTSRYQRAAQIDYFTTVKGDSPANVKTIREALNGYRFSVANGGNCRLNIVGVDRIQEPQGDNLVHYMFSVQVDHSSEAQ